MYKSELNLVFPLRLKEKSDSSCRPLTHEPSYLKQGDLISHTALRRASGLMNYHSSLHVHKSVKQTEINPCSSFLSHKIEATTKSLVF